MNAGTAEAVDIISLEIGKIREGPGIGRAVFSTISSLSSDHCPFHRIRREDQSRADPGLKGHGGGWLYDWKLIPLFALQKTAAGFRRSPPHCLKKNATLAATHRLRMSITQRGSIRRARGPLSPPTITQSMPSRLSVPIGAIRGSIDRKRTAAMALRKWTTRLVACWSSTETPNQTWEGGRSAARFSGADQPRSIVSKTLAI